MKHTLLVLAVLATVASAPLTARRWAGDADAAQMFRVVHYDIAAEVIPSAHALSARATMQVQASSAGQRSIRLYLHEEFAVRRATEGGRVLNVTRQPGGGDRPMFSPSAAPIDIDLGREARENEELTLELSYEGPITGVINGVNLISPTLTELGLYSAWFPMEKAGDAFTYGLTLTMPAGSAAVTDGRLVETTTSGASTTYLFRRETRSGDIPVVAGAALKIRERREGGITARVVFETLDEKTALASLDGVIRCASDMTRLFGAPSSAGAVTVVFAPRGGWGYSRVPMIVGPENALSTQLKTAAGRRENFVGLAHETAHFWWLLADSSTSNDWINEALAEYYAIRAAEAAEGEAPLVPTWRSHHWKAAGVPDDKTIVGTLRNETHAYTLYYQKGSAMIRTLETALGRPALDALLDRFYREHKGRRDATTSTLLAAVRRDFGARFDAFFDRYLNRGGLPGVRVEWQAGPREASGTVTLDDEALVGFPLTIGARGKGATEAQAMTVTLTARTTAWRVALPFDPVDAVVDPEWRLLRADPGAQYSRALVPLVHGPNMDALPVLVPASSIEQARSVVAEWAATQQGGAALNFERGWLAFLDGRPAEAAAHFRAVLPELDDLPLAQFQIPGTYSALGRALDLLGDRASALGYYREGLRRAAGFNLPPLQQIMLFHNFLEVPYPKGQTLHFAARVGNIPLMEELFAAAPGIINSKDPYQGLTPIVWSVQGRIRRPVVEWLVDHGADINARDEQGRTLLEIVRSKGEPEVASYLMSKGAKPAQSEAPLPKEVPLAVLLDRTWAGFEKQFTEAAEAMPEDKFDFKPDGPLFTEVRTFGEQVRHFGAALYYNAAQQLGEPPPVEIEGQSGPDAIRGKTEIMKYLRGGFQYMRRAVSTMTSENATTIVKTPDRVGTRLLFATLAAQHCGDHYGQMVVSLRMNGIVPPASRQPH